MRSGKLVAFTVGAAAILVLAACNTTPKQDVKRVQNAQDARPIAFGSSKRSFALAGIVSSIRRGEPVFAFPASTDTSGQLCNYKSRGDNTETWSGGANYLGSWSDEVGGLFFEELSQMGYQVLGDRSNVFNQSERANSARYLVGGKLTGVKGNFCREHGFWEGKPLDTISGEMSVDMEWSVMDSLTKKIVMTQAVTGYFKQDKPIKRGVSITFYNAMADTVVALGANSQFRKLAVAAPGTAPKQLADKQTGLVVNNGEPADIRAPGGLVRNAVTVRAGTGHGSGFFVGSQGLIMTNAHVVGVATEVGVITNDGIEVTAEVVARHETRDVAILRSPLRVPKAPRLKTELPGITDTVFAVGSPLDEDLRATVTQGIVSALRRDGRTNHMSIQADVAITAGNSGGPLYDDQGRIIGLSVSGYTGTGLNFFIPIGDALEKLGIQLN